MKYLILILGLLTFNCTSKSSCEKELERRYGNFYTLPTRNYTYLVIDSFGDVRYIEFGETKDMIQDVIIIPSRNLEK